MTVLIPNLAIAGYRSFGKTPQRFESFAKLNIIIGQNNSGKSNVIRFLQEIYQSYRKLGSASFDPLARHLPDHPPMLLGIGEQVARIGEGGPSLPSSHPRLASLDDQRQRELVARSLGKMMLAKAEIDKTDQCWTLTLPECKDQQGSWLDAAKSLEDHEIGNLRQILVRMTGGDRRHNWEPQVIERVPASAPAVKVQVIPAIRKIGEKGSISDGFDGTGIIERIAKLQNPGVHSQENRKGFEAISEFLRDVIDRPDASVEIPYERDTIMIHMDGKVLPIQSLGSGIHEVIILAAAATVLNNQVVCIEEPELHLNPILQRKLVRYLSDQTTNQYFITTHSAALMDTPGAEIYHVRLVDGNSLVERATSSDHRSMICEDLGYHPSDLLQANCVIWVEGPSDRIYVNWWIRSQDITLVEGIHYSIMFYGGRLAAHLSNSAESRELADFISLRRLNRRGVMMMDSDKASPHKPINATKRRLRDEFDAGPGFAWITEGREIENYISSDQIDSAIKFVCPTATRTSADGKFESQLILKSQKGKQFCAPKVDIAHHIVNTFSPDLNRFDLKQKLHKLLVFILASNPRAK